MGPTIPSGTKRCAFWKFITEALVIGPKMPSEIMFSLVCKHFTWLPVLPCLRVRVIVQAVGPEFVEELEEKDVQGKPVVVLNLSPGLQVVSA